MILPEGIELPFFISFPITLLLIVGATNAINLADGLDGLAGGMTLFIFICLCALAYLSGDKTVMIMCLAMLGALFGFLSFNTYPASVFMGDAGSQFLGFVSIVLALKITQGDSLMSPVLPLLIMGFPLLDTLIVIWERIRNKRSPFIADNNHFHHKLLSLGFFHTEAVVIIYLLQSIFVASAYIFRFSSDWLILALYLIISCTIIFFFHIAGTYGIKFKRYEIIDKVLKGKLKFLKDRDNTLRIAATTLNVLLPALLITNCAMAEDLPVYIPIISFALSAVIICLWFMNKRIAGSFVHVVLYFIIPAVIYFNLLQPFYLSSIYLKLLYLACCSLCVFSTIVLVRINRRQKSFHVSPMDFIILVIALSAYPLLNTIMKESQTSFFIVQVLILFYSYEILIDSNRRKGLVIATTVGALLILALKGL
jgi:UDP-GlcNAc:undecaprenyl-phosphate GlcNAc-1-phosphate transferase